MLELSAPELGRVTLDRMEVVVHVGQAHRRETLDDQVVALPARVALALPELSQDQGARVAFYLRAAYAGSAGPVELSGALDLGAGRGATQVQPRYAVDLLRPCGAGACLAPARREHAAMAYDPGVGARRVVLFGGAGDNGAVLDDTWEWDGLSWRQAVVTARPPARSAHAMAYDPSRGRVMLFGGRDAAGQVLGDTWEYLGAGQGWREVAVVGAVRGGPPPRAFAAMSGGPVGGGAPGVVLFGGEGADGAALGDTWAWRDGAWVRVAADGPCGERTDGDTRLPWCRIGGGLAAVTWPDGGAEALLIGGVSGRAPDGSQVFDEGVWGWDGTAWRPSEVATPPAALHRWQHRLATTAGGAQVLVIGGEQDGVLLQDSFVLDLRTRLFQPQLGVLPAGRSGAGVALDDERGEVVVRGGRGAMGGLQDTWLFEGSAGWVQHKP